MLTYKYQWSRNLLCNHIDVLEAEHPRLGDICGIYRNKSSNSTQLYIMQTWSFTETFLVNISGNIYLVYTNHMHCTVIFRCLKQSFQRNTDMSTPTSLITKRGKCVLTILFLWSCTRFPLNDIIMFCQYCWLLVLCELIRWVGYTEQVTRKSLWYLYITIDEHQMRRRWPYVDRLMQDRLNSISNALDYGFLAVTHLYVSAGICALTAYLLALHSAYLSICRLEMKLPP